MSQAHSAVTLLLLFLAFSTEGALYGQLLSLCQFISPDGHDAVFMDQYYFNKVLVCQYSSTQEEMTGYTEVGQTIANILNNDPGFVYHQKWKTKICKLNVPLIYRGLMNSVEPYVRLRSVKAASSKHPGILICSMYDFYPKQIRVTWLREGKKVTSDVTSTEELSNGNWLYQMHSHLEYMPRPGEKISCMVEHASLNEPKLYDWGKRLYMWTEPMPEPGINKIIVGTAGLLLGLVFFVAGLIYYKKKSSGSQRSRRSSQVPPQPEEVYSLNSSPVCDWVDIQEQGNTTDM